LKMMAEAPALELEHAIGYSSICGTICWHPNGRKFLYAAGASVVVCDLADPHDQVFLRGHDNDITCLVLSPSGRYVASGQSGYNSDVVVWDFESKSLLYRLSEHDHGISSVAFSHDEKLLCTVGYATDNKIFIWDMSNGHIVTVSNANPSPCITAVWGGMVRNVKRRDTGHYQLATAGNKQLALWSIDPIKGEMESTKVAAEGRGSQVRDFTTIAFSEDLETLYAGTSSGDFVVVNIKQKAMNMTIPATRQGVRSLLTSSQGMLVGGGDGTVTLFDAHSMHDINQTNVGGPVISLCYSPDHTEVLAGTSNGFIRRLRSDSLQGRLVCENHSAPLICVSFSPESSERFATLSHDCSMRVWDATDYSVITSVFVRDAGTPAAMCYTLDFLLSGWSDGRVRAHDAETGKNLWHIDNAHRGGVSALQLSHNERFVITGGVEGEVRVWELRSRELVSHLKEHSGAVNSIALYKDDVHALSCGRDRSVLCWDLRSEKRVTSHVQRMGAINSVSLTKDETLVATVGQEKRLTLWDLRNHDPLSVTNLSQDGSDEAMVVAISGSGKWIATGGTSQLLKIWNTRTMSLMTAQEGHCGTIVDLKFSPDDKQIVTVGADGIILVWNLYS